jgi:tetratricopeptide (TPR) repeat protein
LAGAPDLPRKVDGQKCLANLALCEGRSETPGHENNAGTAQAATEYSSHAVDEALAHLEQALKLAPQDLSIHQDRLHLLEVASRFDEMAAALDESCQLYKSKYGVQAWLNYSVELFEARQYRPALRLLGVLEKYFRDSHEVLGNTAAIYLTLGEYDMALNYLQRALRLSPEDPVDLWNMARTYDLTDKTSQAELWYPKALEVDTDEARRKTHACVYAGFVAKKLFDRARACTLQKTNCPAEEQTACSSSR